MKNFFYYTNSHRNGIVFLSLIIVIIFVVRNAIQKTSQEVYDFSSYKKEISQLRQVKLAKRIKSSTEKTVEPHQSFLTKKTISVEINTADTLAFKSLPAIGEVFSKRICKYRNILGGFNSISQLMEVYGMDSIRFESIRPFLEINTSLIKRNNINTCTKKELQSHPYISYKLASVIINYKHQHGVYKTLSDLTKIHLIDSLKFRKIAPYLTTDENKSVSRTY
jgi:DNA uptake protein ComE-like DNA-binding protein